VSEQPVVVLVLGWGRSGSTLLGDLLGQVPGFFHAGELTHLWARGMLGGWRCGCGEPFTDCPTWKAVLREAFVDETPDAAALDARSLAVRTRHLPLALTAAGRRSLARRFGELVPTTGRLYAAIRQVTGCRVLVDTSKIPAHAYLLDLVPGLDVRVVHLVRDARATAFSWSTRLLPPGGRAGAPHGHSPVESALRWCSWNVAAELHGRLRARAWLRLRYEDLLSRPAESLARIVELAGEPGPPPAIAPDGTVWLEPCHTVSGNPSRFRSGATQLRLDDEWRTRMRRGPAALVTALTWPLLLRHGYLGR